MEYRDIQINIGRMLFSGQEWGNPDGHPVIALHGWLDNAASFTPLAFFLKSVKLLSIDQAGHGFSSHRPIETDYAIWHYVEDLIDIVDTLGLDNFSLLGHSMGAVVSVMAAAILGNRVKKTILLDGLYPLPRIAADAPAILATYIQERKSFRNKKFINRYHSIEHAIRMRCLGQFPVSRNSSTLLVERALYQDGNTWVWRTDPRLHLPSPTRFTKDQALAFVTQMHCDVHVLYTKQSYVKTLTDSYHQCLENIKFYQILGSHHFHMDGQTKAVADIINTIMYS